MRQRPFHVSKSFVVRYSRCNYVVHVRFDPKNTQTDISKSWVSTKIYSERRKNYNCCRCTHILKMKVLHGGLRIHSNAGDRHQDDDIDMKDQIQLNWDRKRDKIIKFWMENIHHSLRIEVNEVSLKIRLGDKPNNYIGSTEQIGKRIDYARKSTRIEVNQTSTHKTSSLWRSSPAK